MSSLSLLYLLAERHYAQAVDLYSKAIDADPNNAIYFSNRSFANLRLENFGSAIIDATKALEIDGTYAKVKKIPSSTRAISRCACTRSPTWGLLILLL